MADRLCLVQMLDGTTRRMNVQSNLKGGELFALVASQYSLHEKEYFGLYFSHQITGLRTWLEPKQSVLEQIPKGKGSFTLTFAVRVFVDDVLSLKHAVTRKLYFEQLLHYISEGHLTCDSNLAFILAAVALQAMQGDFISESATRHHLDAKKLIPDEVLVAQGASLEKCASSVSREYQHLRGMQEESAVLSFLALAHSLPQYGMHFFDVKDNAGLPWLLGVSTVGISLFYYASPTKPRQVHSWDSIVKVTSSKAKFLLHLNTDSYEAGLSSGRHMSLSAVDAAQARKRTLRQKNKKKTPIKITILTWQAPSSAYAKAIVSVCDIQRRFYLPRMNASARAAVEAVSSHTQGGGAKTGQKTSTVAKAMEFEAMAKQAQTSRGSSTSVVSSDLLSTEDSPIRRSSTRNGRGTRAVTIFVPESAATLHKLLSEARSDVDVTIETFSPAEKEDVASRAAFGHMGISEDLDDTDVEALLDRLEKRRVQLASELHRKRELLAKLEKDEQDFLVTLQGSAARDMLDHAHSVPKNHAAEPRDVHTLEDSEPSQGTLSGKLQVLPASAHRADTRLATDSSLPIVTPGNVESTKSTAERGNKDARGSPSSDGVGVFGGNEEEDMKDMQRQQLRLRAMHQSGSELSLMSTPSIDSTVLDSMGVSQQVTNLSDIAEGDGEDAVEPRVGWARSGDSIGPSDDDASAVQEKKLKKGLQRRDSQVDFKRWSLSSRSNLHPLTSPDRSKNQVHASDSDNDSDDDSDGDSEEDSDGESTDTSSEAGSNTGSNDNNSGGMKDHAEGLQEARRRESGSHGGDRASAAFLRMSGYKYDEYIDIEGSYSTITSAPIDEAAQDQDGFENDDDDDDDAGQWDAMMSMMDHDADGVYDLFPELQEVQPEPTGVYHSVYPEDDADANDADADADADVDAHANDADADGKDILAGSRDKPRSKRASAQQRPHSNDPLSTDPKEEGGVDRSADSATPVGLIFLGGNKSKMTLV